MKAALIFSLTLSLTVVVFNDYWSTKHRSFVLNLPTAPMWKLLWSEHAPLRSERLFRGMAAVAALKTCRPSS